jgi:hypothetical protein
VSFTVEPLINTCNTNTQFSFVFFYENLLCCELLHFFQQFTSARYVRLSLQKIRTLNADLMTLRRNFESKFIDPSVTERVSITVWFADSSQSSVSIPNVIIISLKINLFSPWYSCGWWSTTLLSTITPMMCLVQSKRQNNKSQGERKHKRQ